MLGLLETMDMNGPVLPTVYMHLLVGDPDVRRGLVDVWSFDDVYNDFFFFFIFYFLDAIRVIEEFIKKLISEKNVDVLGKHIGFMYKFAYDSPLRDISREFSRFLEEVEDVFFFVFFNYRTYWS